MGNVMTVGFAGEYTDQESGLIYLRARYYDPATALFLTVDPLFSLTRDAYGYADGDPYLNGDPSGLAPPLIAIGAVTGAVWGAGTSLIDGWRAGERGWDLAGRVAIGAAGGAVGGVCFGLTAGMGAACSIAVPAITTAITSHFIEGSVDYGQVALSSAVGAMTSKVPIYSLRKYLDDKISGMGWMQQTMTAWTTPSNTRSTLHNQSLGVELATHTSITYWLGYSITQPLQNSKGECS